MSDGIYTALSGALASARNLDMVANNVANANTTGFRADRMSFKEALVTAQATNPNLVESLKYTEINETRADHSAGSLDQTGAPLDLAIQGDGFFAITTPAGERYTRSGNFVTDDDGVLRTHAGHVVQGVPERPGQPGKQIVIPKDAGRVEIARDGTITAGEQVVGKVRVVKFANNATMLQKEGMVHFSATGGRPQEHDSADVAQGYLEMSNVNAVQGMTELINSSRSFEAYQRVIQGYKQIDERTARDIAGR